MRQKRWTKKGKELKKSNPSLFRGGTGPQRTYKGGAHKSDADYNRADRKAEQRKAQRGDIDE